MRKILMASGFALSLFGCAGPKPLPPLVVTPPLPPVQENPTLLHLLGVWDFSSQGGNAKQMVFERGGILQFHGGLEFFNPGQWVLDPTRKELTLRFPDAPDDKMDIFQLYVHDGIKAFDRKGKQVTYAFDDQTWSLNVAGWIYAKPDKPAAQPEAEPVLK